MGPGPDGNYTREIPKLNAYGNVRTVGYVSTDYTKRNLSLVLQDIGTYSAWSENITAPGLGMNGIFLDETPSQYDDASAEFFETIESAVRSSEGLGINPLVSSFSFSNMCCGNAIFCGGKAATCSRKMHTFKAALLNHMIFQPR
jgi:hypothetical protein